MALSTNLTITYSANGVPVYGTDFAKVAYKRAIAAGEKVNIDVPYGVNCAVITTTSGSNLFVSPTDEDLPESGSWQPTNGYFNKPLINVAYGDTLYLVSESDDSLTVSFFMSGNPL